MKQFVLLFIAVMLCWGCKDQTANENHTSTNSVIPRIIVHNDIQVIPLKPTDFKPLIKDTVSPELRAVLQEIIDNMVYIEGGVYVMGDDAEVSDLEERPLYAYPAHQESVDNFYLSKTEVTQRQWMAVEGPRETYYPNPDKPMENISWVECNAFMRDLQALTGLPFRMPTEEEWEFAAQGGKKTHHYEFPGNANAEKVAWFHELAADSIPPRTIKVGSKAPNELGLYDMGGNVWEFALNDWRNNYCTQPDNSWKTMRGGSFRSTSYKCRPQSRMKVRADFKASHIGLRLAL